MKKVIIIAIIAGFMVVAFSSCNAGSKTLKTDVDSVSYLLGVNMGKHIIENLDEEIDVDVLMAAIKQTCEGKEKLKLDSVGTEFLNNYYSVRKPAKNLVEGVAFLESVEKSNKKAIKTESGLIYEIIEEGDANIKAVSDEDVVRVIYEGKLKGGRVFDSSLERGDTISFPLNRVIKGWTEGMKLVGKGGKIKLWVPAELAYGSHGNQSIGANETLVFDVTLIDVKPAAEVAAEAAAKAEAAEAAKIEAEAIAAGKRK